MHMYRRAIGRTPPAVEMAGNEFILMAACARTPEVALAALITFEFVFALAPSDRFALVLPVLERVSALVLTLSFAILLVLALVFVCVAAVKSWLAEPALLLLVLMLAGVAAAMLILAVLALMLALVEFTLVQAQSFRLLHGLTLARMLLQVGAECSQVLTLTIAGAQITLSKDEVVASEENDGLGDAVILAGRRADDEGSDCPFLAAVSVTATASCWNDVVGTLDEDDGVMVAMGDEITTDVGMTCAPRADDWS